MIKFSQLKGGAKVLFPFPYLVYDYKEPKQVFIMSIFGKPRGNNYCTDTVSLEQLIVSTNLRQTKF